MKGTKAFKITLVILLVILVSMISFIGVFKQNKSIIENVLPEYILSRNLKGHRMVELKAVKEENEETQETAEETTQTEENSEESSQIEETTESKENNSEATQSEENNSEDTENTDTQNNENLEKYKKTKSILKNRLNQMNVADYLIRQNKEDGTIILEIPEDEETDRIIGQVTINGKFEIVDYDTNEVLMTNDDIKSAMAGYGTTSSGVTAIFMNIQFNKAGTQKFKDITNTYVQTVVTKETTQEGENNSEEVVEGTPVTEGEEATAENEATAEPETETVTKQIAIKIDDQELLKTYFTEEISNGLLQLSFGSSSTSKQEDLQEHLIEARNLAAVLDSGNMPVEYEVSQNKFVSSSVEVNQIRTIIIVSVVLFILALVYLIIKYKVKGILASISLIGYVAVLLIAIRYFNVIVSIGGIAAILYSIVICYLITINILKEKEVLKTVGKWLFLLVPTLIIAIVFAFTNITIGAVLFWGIAIALLYNISVNKLLLED